MYDEVLKQGSKIVDGLSCYKQPVFVYIIPNGELRGGAWVVLDPSINAEQMEMYADVDARAGVLEPEGIVEVRLRREKVQNLMERLDATYAALKRDTNDVSKTEKERFTASADLAKRENFLQQTYKQIAILFADLHEYVLFNSASIQLDLIIPCAAEQDEWKQKVVPNPCPGATHAVISTGLSEPV